MDLSGTINPADLNSSALHPSHATGAEGRSQRGLKRSRSPESTGDVGAGANDNDESKPRKRGRPAGKPKSPSQRPAAASRMDPSPHAQTPRMKSQALPQESPSQASPPNPPKATPTGKNVKALPTVRDHTTDQLNPEGDEYIAREFDDAGEKRVTPTGHLNEGREYRCRTFYVPNRGQKLFMLATECARVLNYRDSYLLFNKNRSLHKIIASQTEKEDLIRQEILPYSYRSRQIAIVTARSMYRQFGARMIVNGRRVRDDYWETKARKQGFTEDDLAGEKRPGVTKQKEAATMESTQVNTNAMNVLAHGEIVYANAHGQFNTGMHMGGHPGMGGMVPSNLGQLPMMNLAPSDDPRLREYGNVLRPRQELTGAPYLDRTQSNPSAELINQAAQTAEFNKAISQQRAARGQYLQDAWNRPQPHDIDTSRTAPQPVAGEQENLGQSTRSPAQGPRNPSVGGASPHQMINQQHQSQSHMMTPQQYAQQMSHQKATAQSPVQRMPQQVRPEQMQSQRPPNYTYGSTVAAPSQTPIYGYPQNQMWMTPQQQSSPVSQTHHLPQYGQSQSQHSPHPQQSPHHPPPQLPQAGNPQLGYQSMSSMGAPGPGYSGMSRNLYQPSQSPQQYLPQTSAGQQPGTQQWAPPGTSAPGQPTWHGF